MPSVLTRPAQTLSGIPGTYLPDITISASSSAVIDSVPAVNNRSLKWIITINDDTNSTITSYEILAVNRFNVDMRHTMYARVGDFIDHGVNVQINAGNIELNIKNNETNIINIHVIRMQTIH